MAAAAHRLEFSPPPPPGQGRAWGMAVLAHVILLAALTWGITWQHQDTTLTAEAELWSAQVQQAAPPLQEAPPPPPPPVATPAPPPPPAVREADIALEREKKRLELEKKKQDADKAEAKKKAEAEKKRLDEQKKREAQDKAAKDKAQEQAKARAREEAEAQRAEAQRQENLRRMQGLAGATGAANATGNATQSSGPSNSYAGRIHARIKPNIVYTDDVAGNPVTEVEVRMAPDGTITQRRITKPSTSKSWDDAVLRALDRTAILPRDVDGRVHTPLIITFRPRD
jgi:colicin import membrane protein